LTSTFSLAQARPRILRRKTVAERENRGMTQPIEDYALIGDCKTAALVGRDGSIDWLCWPRFDSAACFAALLGTSENGRWLIAPEHTVHHVNRRYRPGTLILETEFQTETGRAVIVDFMPPADDAHLVRIAIGRSGRVEFRTEFAVHFNYGAMVPWVRLADSMTGQSTRSRVRSVWFCERRPHFTART
jgi:GH15 family glucan-1,4-alpha-glucosidase